MDDYIIETPLSRINIVPGASNSTDPVGFYPAHDFPNLVKGKEWYQASEVAEEYEDKRFSRGGQLIDDRERQAVLSALGPVEDKNILEIAAGTGRFTVMLAERGANVVGIDISAPMLDRGRLKVASTEMQGTIQFVRGDAARLPFPDNHFDAVFAMRFFHLVPTPEQFMVEMRRVTNDIIFFDTFNSPSTRSVYNWLLPMGSRLYNQDEVHHLLRAASLTLEDVQHDFIVPYGCYRILPGAIARSIRQLDEGIGATEVGHHLASVSFWTVREG